MTFVRQATVRPDLPPPPSQALYVHDADEKLRTVWGDLARSDQLEIGVCQTMILEDAFLVLEQLGLQSDPEIGPLFRDEERCRWLRAERRHNRQAFGRKDSQVASQWVADLERLITSSTALQDRILQSVRHRVESHFQYRRDCVAFELFQNADDAAVELVQYFPGEDDRQPDAFEVFEHGAALSFRHFGRKINQQPNSGGNEYLGFDSDLRKMAILSLSSKSMSFGASTDDSARPAVTGKFGLGFKSVFLICRRPHVLSGRLAFQFEGGFFPRALAPEERQDLQHLLEDCKERAAQATLIHLPLDEPGSGHEIVGRFRQFAHVLVAFARQVREIVFHATGTSRSLRWKSIPLPRIDGAESGQLLPLPEVGHEPALILRFGQHGDVLFAMTPYGFRELPSDLPTIWVTAPTLETAGVGFLVNGPFDLDPGRARLAMPSAINDQTADKLGVALGRRLCELFTAAGDSDRWPAIRETLHLAEDADVQGFWESFWILVGPNVAGAFERSAGPMLLKRILWSSPEHGAARLYRACEALPTGLPLPFHRLTRADRVRFSVEGVLAREDVFREVAAWPSVQRHVLPGQVVSHQVIRQPMQMLLPDLLASDVETLTLESVLRQWEFSVERCVLPEDAERLGKVLTAELLDDPAARGDRAGLREQLKRISFLGRDGVQHAARDLLASVPTDGGDPGEFDDEHLRAAFAPGARVLNDAYRGVGLEFFKLCRERLDAPARLMAEWARDADTPARHKAVLSYLVNGRQARELTQELRQLGIAGSWLAELQHPGRWEQLEASEQYAVAELLGIRLEPVGRSGPSPQPPREPGKILHEVHSWWTASRHRYLEDYDRKTYGRFRPRNLEGDVFDLGDAARRDWMTLFLLGVTHTMGWFTPEQHRGFLQTCDEQGAFDLFVSGGDDGERWVKFLEDYLEAHRQGDDQEYLHWMRQFVAMFAIANRLTDYIEAFLSIERMRERFALTAITEPRTFHQSPVDAPPISRLLGAGACFVVRELVRFGVLTNPYAWPHCYVPVRSVRRLVSTILGVEDLEPCGRRWDLSSDIYNRLTEFLEPGDATFCNDFDIPFQFVAKDPDLNRRFLGTLHGFDGTDSDDDGGW